jgi:hypothetical protein
VAEITALPVLLELDDIVELVKALRTEEYLSEADDHDA